MNGNNEKQSSKSLLDLIKQDFVAYALSAFGLVILGSLLLFFRDLPYESGFRNYLVASLVVYVLGSAFLASLLIQLQNRGHNGLLLLLVMYFFQVILFACLILYLCHRDVL